MWFGKLLFVLIFFQVGIALGQSHSIESFKGNWKGTLLIYNQDKLSDSANVTFTVKEVNDTCYTWKLSFESVKYNIEKDYLLTWNEKSNFEYFIDEKDGIVLPAYFIDNTLYSDFTYEDTFLSATYQLIGDQIFYEVRSTKMTKEDKPISLLKTTNTQKIIFHKE